ncbi:MAG: MarC family protein [Desulfatitalea sp.]
MQEFWLCFVPLFVALDVIGVLPIYVSLTEGLTPAGRRSVLVQSIATAAVVALAFLVFGPVLLQFLGITVADFMIAGGSLLFAISLSDLLTGEQKRSEVDKEEALGAVPLGIPLLAGPALFTTSILLANAHGKGLTAAALAANLLIAGGVFVVADTITRWLGRNGTRTASKIASLLLAAIAVMLVRKGVIEAIASAIH